MNKFKKWVRKKKEKERLILTCPNGDTPINIDITKELEKCIDESIGIEKEVSE